METSQQTGLWKKVRASLADFTRELGFGIVFGYILGALMYIACFFIAFRMKPEEWWLNLLLTFFGGIVGWTVGVLLSPVTPGQKETFAGIGKAFSAFMSGFVIGKFDVLVKAFGGTLDIRDVVSIGRLLLFGTTFFLGCQFTFIARWKKPDEPQTNELPASPAK